MSEGLAYLYFHYAEGKFPLILFPKTICDRMIIITALADDHREK